ncbi:MAG: glycosyltransferase [Candidatus Zixiibacteriota bacterium]|nr:MAG: glycosyltransferase [candidate division Zixibacteria bacterium]
MEYHQASDVREALSRGDTTPQKLIELANGYLAENRLDSVYPIVTVLAESPEASVQTILTAGLVALAKSDMETAAGWFGKALRRDPSNFDAAYNLALLDVQCGALEQARCRFQSLIEASPQHAPLYNDLGVICAGMDDLPAAVEAWQRALSLDPNYTLARDNAMEAVVERKMVTEGKRLLRLNAACTGVSSRSVKEIENWAERLDSALQDATYREASVVASKGEKTAPAPLKGKKIAVFASLDSFVKDIAGQLSADNEVQTFTGGTVERLRQLMDWADLAWFEWCDNFIIEATKLPKTCQIVCRLHSYEAFDDMPAQVDWSKVDLLIYVNESVRAIVNKKIKIDTPSVVIHNAVDTERFVIPPGKVYGKKIASVGYINYKKNPSLLLYCFKKIHEHDPAYTFHVAGRHQDPRIELYFEHFLRENPLPVTFNGWVEDMPQWYRDKDYIISTSLFESFHYSIAEGMACGLMPLIHNWYGARRLYPERFLSQDPDGCLALLKRLEGGDRARLAEPNRDFILERYSLPDQMEKVTRALGRVLREREEEPLALES